MRDEAFKRAVNLWIVALGTVHSNNRPFVSLVVPIALIFGCVNNTIPTGIGPEVSLVLTYAHRLYEDAPTCISCM